MPARSGYSTGDKFICHPPMAAATAAPDAVERMMPWS